jgi:hypothetical protein
LQAEPTPNPSSRGTLLDAALPRWRDLGPWIAVVTGPLAVLTQVTFGFVLAPTARHLDSKALLFAITALMLLATALAAWACERQRQQSTPRSEDAAAGAGANPASRARFVGLGGLWLNLFSLLALLAQLVPIIVLGLED